MDELDRKRKTDDIENPNKKLICTENYLETEKIQYSQIKSCLNPLKFSNFDNINETKTEMVKFKVPENINENITENKKASTDQLNMLVNKSSNIFKGIESTFPTYAGKIAAENSDIKNLNCTNTTNTNLMEKICKERRTTRTFDKSAVERENKKLNLFLLYLDENDTKKFSNKVIHRCEICKREFNEIVRLWRHRHEHGIERPYTCPICFYGFHSTYKIRRHLFVHSVDKKCVCKICGASFDKRGKLVTHLNNNCLSVSYQDINENCLKNNVQNLANFSNQQQNVAFDSPVSREYGNLNANYSNMYYGTTNQPNIFNMNLYQEQQNSSMPFQSWLNNTFSHYWKQNPINSNSNSNSNTNDMFNNLDNSIEKQKPLTFTKLKNENGFDSFDIKEDSKLCGINNGLVKCQVCKKEIHKKNLNRHMETHSDFYSYACTACSYKTRRLETLRTHLQKRHKDEINLNDVILSNECRKLLNFEYCKALESDLFKYIIKQNEDVAPLKDDASNFNDSSILCAGCCKCFSKENIHIHKCQNLNTGSSLDLKKLENSDNKTKKSLNDIISKLNSNASYPTADSSIVTSNGTQNENQNMHRNPTDKEQSTCSLCSQKFENSFYMRNHYFQFHPKEYFSLKQLLFSLILTNGMQVENKIIEKYKSYILQSFGFTINEQFIIEQSLEKIINLSFTELKESNRFARVFCVLNNTVDNYMIIQSQMIPKIGFDKCPFIKIKPHVNSIKDKNLKM
ncbi:hypothetical protein A3Q56_05222 [Intoshia linei]|uniref:C2H2-type domain-containing protein n=1 Tax=Intoshia linei TaxID=1819745 RepID=A0A177AYC3_9BILA|nr:hypothetical protein A3Q56_05222 [Intoshia linei]